MIQQTMAGHAQSISEASCTSFDTLVHVAFWS
jgi:hypothetical protein